MTTRATEYLNILAPTVWVNSSPYDYTLMGTKSAFNQTKVLHLTIIHGWDHPTAKRLKLGSTTMVLEVHLQMVGEPESTSYRQHTHSSIP